MTTRIPSLAALTLGLMTTLSVMTSGNAQEIKVKGLEIEQARVFATRPGQPHAGGFLKIENKSGPADRLLGVSVAKEIAASAEIHTMEMKDNTMVMRAMPSLDLPQKGTIRLEPGSQHLMLMNLNKPLVKGQTVPVVLRFEKAGEVPVSLLVVERGEMGHGSGHGGMKH